jgi:peptidoglycan/LPS O-acetylase OafA/YrhL
VVLGDISYALFLVHFSVCVMANAVFVRFTDQSPHVAIIFFLAAWAGSLPLAALLHRWVERPLAKRRQSDG